MNTSAEQDNGDYSSEDKMHDKTSASANKGINEKLSVQTKLPFKHSKQVYTCSRCLVCICGEVTYKKHMDNCSKYKCVICKKTFFSDRTFKNINVTALQKDIHVQFVRKTTLESRTLINI